MNEQKKAPTFRELCDSLPRKGVGMTKRRWLSELASICTVSELTIRNWVYQPHTISEEQKNRISAYLGIPSNQLFPQV